MKNWKTTVAGLLMASGALLIQNPNPVFHLIGEVLVIGAPLIFGAVAKDHNVTGTGK